MRLAPSTAKAMNSSASESSRPCTAWTGAACSWPPCAAALASRGGDGGELPQLLVRAMSAPPPSAADAFGLLAGGDVRTAAVTGSLGALRGLSMISIGNSLPSSAARSARSRADLLSSASSAEPEAVRDQRSAKPSGMMFLTLCRPARPGVPNFFSAWSFSRTISPLVSTTTIASGAASRRPRYRPSTWARCCSASLRTLMSRIAAVTRIPSALSRGLSMISMGNSLPSLRRPESSIPVPICCASASAAVRVPSAISRSAKPSGMMFSHSAPPARPRSRTASSACRSSDGAPPWFTTTTRSARSREPRHDTSRPRLRVVAQRRADHRNPFPSLSRSSSPSSARTSESRGVRPISWPPLLGQVLRGSHLRHISHG